MTLQNSRIRYRPACLALGLLGLTACEAPVERQEPAPPETPPPAEVRIAAASVDAAALDQAAKLLAGLTPATPPEAAAETWQQHGDRMAEIWSEIEGQHLGAMRTWAAAELAPADPRAPLFYPFSGPDLPSAMQFFPEAASYVLVGLESPGRIPDLDSIASELDAPALEAELGRLRTSLDNLASAGYFVTKRMETDFVAAELEGALPFLYLFLARAGMPPTAVHFVSLEPDGSERAMATDVRVAEHAATAVRIDFGTDGTERSLYYFSRDLSNAGLQAKPSFVAFLKRLGAFNVYLKSASYLLHMEDFTDLEALLLDHAGAVLQDDSGIPLRDFSPAVWERQFFGTYTQTLPTYREWYQDDLRAAFERVENPQPLPFAIGYHSKTGGSCLIWAQRRSDP
ncbi:MAG: hypothetical protein AAF560_12035 [Acidobacteriota bacterium]